MLSNPKVIEALVQKIVEAVHPLKIILFGSYTQDKPNPESDIDVLVAMPEGFIAGELHNCYIGKSED